MPSTAVHHTCSRYPHEVKGGLCNQIYQSFLNTWWPSVWVPGLVSNTATSSRWQCIYPPCFDCTFVRLEELKESSIFIYMPSTQPRSPLLLALPHFGMYAELCHHYKSSDIDIRGFTLLVHKPMCVFTWCQREPCVPDGMQRRVISWCSTFAV